MGLLKKIKKGFKSVVKGVKKGFKKAVGAIGKFARSKFGKIFLIALTVVTLGIALYAAAAAYTATAGTFLTKFVVGAKAFVGALASPIKAAKGLIGGAAPAGQAATLAAGTAQTAGVAGEVAGATGAVAGEAAAAGASTAGIAGAAAPAVASAAAPVAATSAAPAATGGFLSRAAGAAGNFVASPAGAQLIGSVATGYAQGKQQEEAIKEQNREIQRREDEYSSPEGVAALNAVGQRQYNLGGGFMERARRVNDFLKDRQYSYPGQAGDPSKAFGTYARAPETPMPQPQMQPGVA